MFEPVLPQGRCFLALSFATLAFLGQSESASAQNYATSDSQSGYVHWIELRDASGRTIDPADEDAPPYSPQQTCGRCHDFNTISHGWHFNAVDESSRRGRPGQPWIWSDLANGIHMPLSYREWQGTFNPDKLEISRWQMAEKFGGFLPGGGPGSAESLKYRPEFTIPTWKDPKDDDEPESDGPATPGHFVDLSNVTGELPVDCMLCHHRPGSGYSPFAWTEQIEDRNFAYAPTVAMGIGTVDRNSLRLKEDFDRTEDADKLPNITYDAQRFRHDGMIFFDLIRKPANDSCYYCHTNISTDTADGGRWLHDEDVHVRAGIACADCHRNGLDHETVRGFNGEQHASLTASAFSCQGCHLGSSESNVASGRLGAPRPLHKGLPPLHFGKLSCTACHSGKLPSETLPQQFNSIAHRLGEHVRRTGDEAPGIVASALLPLDWQPSDGGANADSDAEAGEYAADDHATAKLTPHRMMWPSYWGLLSEDGIQPLNPEQAREIVRKGLRIKRDFTEELAKVKLSTSEKKEALGDRYRTKEDEWTDEEKAKVESLTEKLRDEQITEKMVKALQELEEGFPESTAVYITGGQGFALGDADDLRQLSTEELGDAAEPYAWPMAHTVRPASQSLGIGGCTDCHRTDAPLFATEVRPVGLLPGQETEAFAISDIQGLDVEKLSIWNSMFDGRSLFKVLGLIALGLTCVVAVSACAVNLSNFWRR